MGKLKVILVQNYNNKYKFKIKDIENEIYFYINHNEFNKLDKRQEYRRVGSNLILGVKDNKLIDIKFDIFCYDKNWEDFQNEIKTILDNIKLKK